MTAVMLINQQPLSTKEYQGHRLVSFKDIDALHERPEGAKAQNDSLLIKA